MKSILANNVLNINPQDYSLLTDLYQLTMSACYVGEGIADKRASFELFMRRLPNSFGYLIAMGLAQAIEYLEQLSFSPQQIEGLQATGIFNSTPAAFWQLLKSSSFIGDVWAVPEGTAIFANEPILRIEAPLWQAQLVETYLLNTINYQTLIATKAARIRDIAGGDADIIEFGTRRAFSPQGSMWAARAALAAGFDGTSNVLAALKLGEKPRGTMAHALVMAISAISGDEDEAFSAFQNYFPQAPLLIDTYDTVAATKRLQSKVNAGEMRVPGVRIDSGDLVELSQKVDRLLPDTKIFVSGDLDEWEIARLKQEGAVIDGYGIGTKLVTGVSLGGVYKLVEIDRIPTMKQSSNKVSYPGCKQIFRTVVDGKIQSDRLGLADEQPQDGEQCLLVKVMQSGKRLQPTPALSQIRQRTTNSVASLSGNVRSIDNPQPLTVNISDALKSLQKSISQHNPAINN
ncbi:nicotinate phosphoribosyltransferase [Waterburya agarophytonicola K14]|uniref:Nicotinate phosphoribosyltransferase n=1 Tax=Waterburya agarophytonicola KI4 TaxID=2874699 RepID=A0A964FJ37_9CYAN|nr:nicotinate phosphoribosyltransferase [Waterburya agarophytonicola]MCC0178468.1 nicotinate phosphoribosyltransferase [Waterburya agarophytonicola KI4]